jgi:hypothetical protein
VGAWIKAHIGKISIGPLLAAAFAIGYWVHQERAGEALGARPNEYLYLDAARVNAYLGQLQNGLPSSVTQGLSDEQATNVTVPVGAVNLGASDTTTRSTQQTVTPDEGDRLYALIAKLRGPLKRSFYHINLDSVSASQKISSVSDGDFVELDNARLSSPRFALVVPALAQGYQRYLAGEKLVPSNPLSSAITSYPKQVQAYLRALGPNPTIPLRVVVKGDPQGVDRMLLPTLLHGLLNSSTLISGNVTVLGVVARQIAEQSKTKSPYEIGDARYFDAAAAIATERAIAHHLSPKVGAALELPHSKNGVAGLVDDAETVQAPGTIIVPIAIFL